MLGGRGVLRVVLGGRGCVGVRKRWVLRGGVGVGGRGC